MSETKIAVVIPVGPGRLQNLQAVLGCLTAQTEQVEGIVVVEDGPALGGGRLVVGDTKAEMQAWGKRILQMQTSKHEPGREQPRNLGVRYIKAKALGFTHVWFLDSDVVVEPDCHELLLEAITDGPQDRIVVAPYDWLPPGKRPEPGTDFDMTYHAMRNDPRWPSFDTYGSDETLHGDLAAGLACFSGNLIWPIDEFVRVGGFWNEIHHGRCEDGELGLRAVAMDVGIGFARGGRGWHLHHPVNVALAVERNARDVPMLNERHPWVEGSNVFMVDRDGKAFDTTCPGCGAQVPTIDWWNHAEACGVAPAIPVTA